MEIKGIYIIKEALKKYSKESVLINTFHKLYGKQKIMCKLDYIFDDERVGFKAVNGQEIFIYRDEIIDYGIKDGIYFADSLMEIQIKKLHRQ